jgi:hypothetical protein
MHHAEGEDRSTARRTAAIGGSLRLLVQCALLAISIAFLAILDPALRGKLRMLRPAILC